MNKKGFSMVALAASLTIVMILLTTVTISVVNSLNNSRKVQFALEINSIEASINTYYVANGEYPTGSSVTLDLTGIDSYKDQILANGEVPTSDNKVILYEIDYSKIGNLTTNLGNGKNGENDIYALSQETGRVYYLQGLKIGSEVYFTLTEDLKNVLSQERNGDIFEPNNAIIFLPSTKEWTNEEISVTVKVPKDYIINSINATKTGSDNNYNLYEAKGTSNFNIEIKYTTDEDTTNVKVANYAVTNFDNVKPKLVIDNNINEIVDETTDAGFINITERSDSISGVKFVKFEEGNIKEDEAYEYFQNNGKLVEENTIVFSEKADTLTVYIQDNAGNFDVEYINVWYSNDGLLLNFDARRNIGDTYSSSTTTWKDISGNNNDLKLVGRVTWSDYSLVLSGLEKAEVSNIAPKFVTIETTMSLSESRSRVIGSNLGLFKIINEQGDGIQISISPKNMECIIIYDIGYNTYSDSFSISFTDKQYIATTYDGKVIKMFLNGNLVKSINVSGFIDYGSDTANLYIGNFGNLYNLRVYDRALGDEEIKTNYNFDNTRYKIN